MIGKNSITFILLLIILHFFMISFQFRDISESEATQSESWENYFVKSKLNSPTITKILVNNSQPTPHEDIKVSAVISDSTGINNATLFWTYDSINSTLFNSSMLLNSTLLDSASAFQFTGYVFPNGTETNTATNRRFGKYTYETMNDEFLSHFELDIQSSGPNNLVYISVERKNPSSGGWESVFIIGDINTSSEIGPITYSDYNLTAGYRIYAVNWRSSTNPGIPTINTLDFSEEYYYATIPAPHKPAHVTYQIKAFDIANSLTQSNNFGITMNSPISFLINTIPTQVDTNNFFVNVSLTDLDGVDNIDHSSVKAFYRIIDKTSLQNISLNFANNINSTTASFTGSIDVTNLLSNENNILTIYFTAQDLIPGFTSLATSSNFEVTLIGDPSLPPLSTAPPASSSSSSSSSSTTNTSSSGNGGNSTWNEFYSLLGMTLLGLGLIIQRRVKK